MLLKGPQRVIAHVGHAHELAHSTSDLNRVKAILRVRPFLPHERAQSESIQVTGKQAVIVNPRNPSELLQYNFDSCYDGSAQQSEIFTADVIPVIMQVLRGYNATIFAYGNTGAGKTHTMEGTTDQPGMIPRTLEFLFGHLAKATRMTAKLRLSYMEIYKEKVYDLLSLSEADLPIREDQNKNIVIPALCSVVIESYADFEKCFSFGLRNRSTAATKLNTHSSRSHSCLLIQIEQSSNGSPGVASALSKLHLIDLAGSEDNRRTDNSGDRLVESGSINKSLFVLSQSRIPYRDSKLTRLLQDSLGGKSLALMITNVAPNETFTLETFNTLNFASKSRQIENRIEKTRQIGETVSDRSAQLNAWKNKKQPSLPNCEPVKNQSKRIRTSFDETLATSRSGVILTSSIEAPTKTKSEPLNKPFSNPFDDNSSALEAELMERRIEDKVNQKLKELSKGTILSPLLKSRDQASTILQQLLQRPESELTGSRLANKENERSSRAKVLDIFAALKQNKDNGIGQAIVERKKSAKNEQSSHALKTQLQTLLPLVEADLLQIVNHGNIKQIKSLREIGEKRAQSIVDHRLVNGPVLKLSELVEMGLFTEKVLMKIVMANAIGKIGNQ